MEQDLFVLRTRATLIPIVELWSDVARVLALGLKEAADFVEQQFIELGLTLYLQSVDTPLYCPLKGENKDGIKQHEYWLMEVWNSIAGHQWTPSDTVVEEWKVLCITLEDKDQIIAKARDVVAVWQGDVTVVAAPRAPRSPENLRFGTDANPELDPQKLPRWPWGNHHTQLLGHLEAAARRYWVNVSPDDMSTAPTNADISKWLQEDRKVSKSMAESIATILRKDGLPTGPRR